MLDILRDKLASRRRQKDGAPGSIDLNPVLGEIGHFGKFHWRELGLLWMVCLASGVGIVSFAFTGFVPKYRCSVPACESPANATFYHHQSSSLLLSGTNASELESKPVFADFVEASIFSLEAGQHACRRRVSATQDFSGSCQQLVTLIQSNDNSTTVDEQCGKEELVYDRSVVESSFATRFGLVCDDYYLRGIFNSFVMGGMLLGSFMVGIISDRYGRKTALNACIVLLWIAGIINAFTTYKSVYAICRLIIGMTSIGSFLCAYVLIAESTLPNFTVRATKMMGNAFTFGELIVVLVAYFIRDEYHLQLALFTPLIALLIPGLLVKESTRWMISKGYISKAKKQIAHMAEVNGKVSADRLAVILSQEHRDDNVDKEEEDRQRSKKNESNGALAAGPVAETTDSQMKPKKARFWDLFRPAKICIRTINLFFQWFTVTAIFYGLSFGSTSILGDPYTNFALSCAMELPSYIVGFFTFDRIGRKWSLIPTQLCGGLACVIVGLVNSNPQLAAFQTTMVCLGRFCASLAFGIVYLYCIEMYMTPLRASSLGTCSTIGRVGGIFALSIEGLKVYWQPLPFILIGGCGIIAGISALALPETTGEKLPDTVEESLQIGKNYKLTPCCGLKLARVSPS